MQSLNFGTYRNFQLIFRRNWKCSITITKFTQNMDMRHVCPNGFYQLQMRSFYTLENNTKAGIRQLFLHPKCLFLYHKTRHAMEFQIKLETSVLSFFWFVTSPIRCQNIQPCALTTKFGHACKASRTPGMLKASWPLTLRLSRYRGWRPYSCSTSGIFFKSVRKLESVKPEKFKYLEPCSSFRSFTRHL